MSCRLDRSSPAAITGGYSGWTTPYSYNSVRELQLDIGLLSNGTCLRSGQLEELIHCQPGQIKLPPDQLKDRCLELNLTCPDVSCRTCCPASAVSADTGGLFCTVLNWYVGVA